MRLLIFKYKDIYELSINLPCDVDVEKCNAKFDKSKKILNVVCSILDKKIVEDDFLKDPEIGVIYEENNKVVEKKSKVEEVKINDLDDNVRNGKVEECKNKEENEIILLKSEKNDEIFKSNENKKNEEIEGNKINSKNEFLEQKGSEEIILKPQIEENIQTNRIEEINNENQLKEEKNEIITEKISEDMNNNSGITNNVVSIKENKLYYLNYNCSLIFDIE